MGAALPCGSHLVFAQPRSDTDDPAAKCDRGKSTKRNIQKKTLFYICPHLEMSALPTILDQAQIIQQQTKPGYFGWILRWDEEAHFTVLRERCKKKGKTTNTC